MEILYVLFNLFLLFMTRKITVVNKVYIPLISKSNSHHIRNLNLRKIQLVKRLLQLNNPAILPTIYLRTVQNKRPRHVQTLVNILITILIIMGPTHKVQFSP